MKGVSGAEGAQGLLGAQVAESVQVRCKLGTN